MILAVFLSGLPKIVFGKSAASAALAALGLTFPTALLVRADEMIE
jgi:hypothetical protein